MRQPDIGRARKDPGLGTASRIRRRNPQTIDYFRGHFFRLGPSQTIAEKSTFSIRLTPRLFVSTQHSSLRSVSPIFFQAAGIRRLSGPGNIQDRKINPNIVATPDSQLQGRREPLRIGDWLEVEVEFSTTRRLIDERLSILHPDQWQVAGRRGDARKLPGRKEHHSVACASRAR